MHLWPLPHPSNLVRMINWLGKFLTTSRMENQNKDCWLIEKWKKLWTDEIMALEVYIPTMQNSLFGQWVTGWPDYLDSQFHPCLPILSSWKVITSLLWYVVSSGIVQVISQMEFISQGALGCSPVRELTIERWSFSHPSLTLTTIVFLIKKWTYD